MRRYLRGYILHTYKVYNRRWIAVYKLLENFCARAGNAWVININNQRLEGRQRDREASLKRHSDGNGIAIDGSVIDRSPGPINYLTCARTVEQFSKFDRPCPILGYLPFIWERCWHKTIVQHGRIFFIRKILPIFVALRLSRNKTIPADLAT